MRMILLTLACLAPVAGAPARADNPFIPPADAARIQQQINARLAAETALRQLRLAQEAAELRRQLDAQKARPAPLPVAAAPQAPPPQLADAQPAAPAAPEPRLIGCINGQEARRGPAGLTLGPACP